VEIEIKILELIIIVLSGQNFTFIGLTFDKRKVDFFGLKKTVLSRYFSYRITIFFDPSDCRCKSYRQEEERKTLTEKKQ
jgi:hypothetical protein